MGKNGVRRHEVAGLLTVSAPDPRSNGGKVNRRGKQGLAVFEEVAQGQKGYRPDTRFVNFAWQRGAVVDGPREISKRVEWEMREPGGTRGVSADMGALGKRRGNGGYPLPNGIKGVVCQPGVRRVGLNVETNLSGGEDVIGDKKLCRGIK